MEKFEKLYRKNYIMSEFQVIDWVYVALCAAPLLYAVFATAGRPSKPQKIEHKPTQKPINKEPELIRPQPKVSYKFMGRDKFPWKWPIVARAAGPDVLITYDKVNDVRIKFSGRFRNCYFF